jgi:hypothetical protein
MGRRRAFITLGEFMVAHDSFKTPHRMEWPTVLLVALDRDLALKVTEGLGDDGFTVVFAPHVKAGRERVPVVMPHAIVVQEGLDPTELGHLEEVARAVGAEVITVPANAHPAIVREVIVEATDRTSERRLKIF